MKHSIKREQSHARMSFAEFENQRSLAEGESNVRATLKHMKLSFHLILTLALWLTMAQTAMAAITGSGTADDPYLISSTEDWNTFANNVNNGTSYSGQTVKLNADISVTTMVGTYDNPFNGTFDGGGHTLSVTLNNDSQYGDEDAYYGVAPFRFTNGATIQFLVVTGIVTTSTRKYAAGLIGMTKGGTNTILNCISSVEIYSTINNKWGDKDGTHGGFIGKASGTVTINNSLFNGQLTTTNDNPTINCGGFVGWRDGTLSISNCLYAPNTTIPSGKVAIDEGATFSRNDVTPTYSYYTQTLGAAQGTAVGTKTATELVAALGSAWSVSSGRAVPNLLLSAKSFTHSNIEAGLTNQLNYDGNLFISAMGESKATKSTMNPYIILRGEYQQEGTLRLYPRISGNVKSVVFSSAYTGTGNGYMKIGKGTTWTNSVSEDMTGNNPWTSISFTTSDGIQLENEKDYLEIKLYNSQSKGSFFSKGSITIIYEPTAATLTHTHDFSYSKNSNTLTVTCAHNDGKTCDLASSNYQATLTLSPSVDTYYRPYSTYSATLNLGPFNALTGLNATATDITYVNNTTGDNLGSTAPTTAGNYTASVTVTVGGTNYSLSTDFKVNTENSINNNIRQISVSKTSAANDEEITITFTPRSHELVNTLTVTGATTNKSIGNGITKVDEYTYTFTMPFEEVTIGATFKSSDASLYKYAITTDITGSGAVDYNAEEYLGAGDAITITFMPYLQGNLEVGSVVLEGLTVTGTTTNMSVGNGITDNGNNTYTFTMPGENVTVTAKAYLSAGAILAGTINEPIYIKQGNGIQIGCNNKWTYVNDGALPLVIPDGNTLRLAGGTDVRLDLADKNAIACEGDAIVELIPNEVSNEIWIGDRPERNSGKATIKVGPAGKTLTIRVADESTETVHLDVKSISQYDRKCDVIGCDEGGSCGSIVVESGQVESREYFNNSGLAFRTTDGTITFGYKYPNDKIIFDGGSEGTVKIEDGKQFHSYTDYNTKYSGTINLQGINTFDARPDKYTVTFDENGGSDVDNQTVAHGMKATEPATTREGFTFVCWKNGEDAYDFNTVVTSDLTLKAKWKRPITSEGISISIPSQEWTGSELTPVITVTDGTTTLNEGTDYTVTAPIGTVQNTGNYTYTITGVGNYSGETTATFTITQKAVTITLSGEYGTYCSTVDLDFSEATGLTAYIAAGYNKSEGSLLMVKVTSVPAGTGLLLKGTPGSTYTAKGQTSPYVYSNLLTGTIAETDVTTNDLILGKNEDKIGFYRVSGSGKLDAGKAYLKDMAPAAGARMLSLEFYDDATGIADVRSKMSDAVTEDWYSLDGRKLQGRPTKKGLYLLNGKKVVVR